MTTASVIAVAMDTLTVPRRTPKYAFARTTIESRIQTRLEKSSKTIFYAIRQLFLERQRRICCGDQLLLIMAASAPPHSLSLAN
jgi:hypothetical protein